MKNLQTIYTMDTKGKISMDKIWVVHMFGKKNMVMETYTWYDHAFLPLKYICKRMEESSEGQVSNALAGVCQSLGRRAPTAGF